ncbi:hypothetical protein [Nostoc sp.]
MGGINLKSSISNPQAASLVGAVNLKSTIGNLQLFDRETGRRGAEKDWALNASCQIEAQRNWSINNLRADLR